MAGSASYRTPSPSVRNTRLRIQTSCTSPLGRVEAENPNPLEEDGLGQLAVHPLQVLGQARDNDVVTMGQAPESATSMEVGARAGAAPS